VQLGADLAVGEPIGRTGFADDLDVALGVEQLGDAATDDLVLVEQEHDGHGPASPRCVLQVTVVPSGVGWGCSPTGRSTATCPAALRNSTPP
jgi:hypothetical protein